MSPSEIHGNQSSETNQSSPDNLLFFHPLSLAIREKHFQGEDNTAHISADAYSNTRGLLGKPVIPYMPCAGPTPSTTEITTARITAVAAYADPANKIDRVVITIYDASSIPKNNRNAPYDGAAAPLNPDSDLTDLIFPKVQTGDPGNQYYDWLPLDVNTIIHLLSNPSIHPTLIEDSNQQAPKKIMSPASHNKQLVTKSKSPQRKRIDERKNNRFPSTQTEQVTERRVQTEYTFDSGRIRKHLSSSISPSKT